MTIADERLAAFHAELRELLLKHHAVIEVGYGDCSDTHGMYDEHMRVCFTDVHVTRQIADNWGIEPYDLK